MHDSRSIELKVLAPTMLNVCSGRFLMPPKKKQNPKTNRRLEIMEPSNEPCGARGACQGQLAIRNTG
jgi:hypothetical protein